MQEGLKVSLLQSQYILSLLLLVNNKDMCNLEINPSINIRQNSNLYQPSSNLATYQKGIYYFGIRVFNSPLPQIKNLSNNIKQFKSALKSSPYTNSFYSLSEYLNVNKEWQSMVHFLNHFLN
jgi:hypothetical protein